MTIKGDGCKPLNYGGRDVLAPTLPIIPFIQQPWSLDFLFMRNPHFLHLRSNMVIIL